MTNNFSFFFSVHRTHAFFCRERPTAKKCSSFIFLFFFAADVSPLCGEFNSYPFFGKILHYIEKRAFFESETMFATQSLTKQFSATATCSFTRKQQKQSRRRDGNQIARASSTNVEKPKDSPSPTSSSSSSSSSSASSAAAPPTPPKKEDRKIVNGQDVPSFEDISTAHFRISSGTFSLSLCFRIFKEIVVF